MSTTTHITIGICTFRRAHIVNTLASIAEQKLPLDSSIHIIVADNDDEPSAQTTVSAAASQFGLSVTYIHAPARNISIARNACIAAASGDYFVFIDDDELADSLWLSELIDKQRTSGAELILGRVIALYPTYCPKWMLRGDFHATNPDYVDGKIITGYSGNLLMNLHAPSLSTLRFDETYGVTGGEDTDYFRRAHNAGARIDYAPAAIVYEPVPQDRASLKWLLKRRTRYGQTHAAMLLAQKRPRLVNIVTAAAKMLVCYVMVLATALSPIGRRRWLLRGTLHRAVMRTLWQAK